MLRNEKKCTDGIWQKEKEKKFHGGKLTSRHAHILTSGATFIPECDITYCRKQLAVPTPERRDCPRQGGASDDTLAQHHIATIAVGAIIMAVECQEGKRFVALENVRLLSGRWRMFDFQSMGLSLDLS